MQRRRAAPARYDGRISAEQEINRRLRALPSVEELTARLEDCRTPCRRPARAAIEARRHEMLASMADPRTAGRFPRS